jgi:23S rRNA (adenine2503-C2)-methyltransferase
MSKRVTIHDTASVDAVRRELGIDPHYVHRMRTVFLKKFAGREAALNELPPAVRTMFADQVEFYPLSLDARLDSAEDGATKLVFATASGKRIESVLLRAGTGRTALCISSQVGCAANCDFCATGKMGFYENLTAGEMLDQVVQANEQIKDEGRTVRNIVLMGMGEPFHNEPAVYQVLDTLVAGRGFNHPASRILVSTVGIPEAMLRCGRRFPAVNLALSLHAVRQEDREQIIPLARKYPLDELRRTIVELNAIQPGALMVEYLMLAGVNDSLDDASELEDFCRGLRVHVNLIPYNAIEGAPHLVGSSRTVRDAFADRLKAAGLTTTIRYSMGADIEAACGQLVQQMERRRRQPVTVEERQWTI